MNIPQDLKYTKEHEWIRVEGNRVTVGITDYAQDQLGDIVFVELPAVGDEVESGDGFAVLESVKAAADGLITLSISAPSSKPARFVRIGVGEGAVPAGTALP